ncbi:MAG: replication protein [Chloroflexota bacterium]|nr:replication protein [Chloroflexota bacterium]
MSKASIQSTAPPNNTNWPGYFDVPTWTPVPDLLITFWLPQLSGSELKIALYVVRHTFGYHRDAATIPFDRFLNGTFARDGRRLDWGAGVRKTQLTESLADLAECGILVRRRQQDQRGGDAPSAYALNLRGKETEPGPRPTDYGVPAPYAFTPVPNQVFDVLLPHLKERHLKTLLYITHHTSGLKRRHADITRSQMLRGTITPDHRILDRGVGISERPLDAALKDLAEMGVIFREEQRSPQGGALPTRYGLNVAPTGIDTPVASGIPLPVDSGEGVPVLSEGGLPVDSGGHVKEHVLKNHERHENTRQIAFKPFAGSALDSRQAWATALLSLQTVKGADGYLKGSKLLARDGDEFVVGVSSAYAAAWLGRRLADEAARQLSAIGGERVGVQFVAESQYQPPAASAQAG